MLKEVICTVRVPIEMGQWWLMTTLLKWLTMSLLSVFCSDQLLMFGGAITVELRYWIIHSPAAAKGSILFPFLVHFGPFRRELTCQTVSSAACEGVNSQNYLFILIIRITKRSKRNKGPISGSPEICNRRGTVNDQYFLILLRFIFIFSRK